MLRYITAGGRTGRRDLMDLLRPGGYGCNITTTMPTTFQALERVPNACQLLPNVVTGGQPSTADLEGFRDAGGGIVLDLRDPMEPRPLDESATAERLGLEYVVVPVSAGTMTDATLERIHCDSAGSRRPAAVHPLRQRQPGGWRAAPLPHAGTRTRGGGRHRPGDAGRAPERRPAGVGARLRQTQVHLIAARYGRTSAVGTGTQHSSRPDGASLR